MSELEYNPGAIKKLNETMGAETRERMPCGVVIKNKPNDRDYAKSALEAMKDSLKDSKK